MLFRSAAGPSGARIVAENGYLPAYRTPETISLYSSNPLAPEGFSYFAEATDVRPSDQPDPDYAILESIFQQEGELALIGEKTVDEAIAEIERRRRVELPERF